MTQAADARYATTAEMRAAYAERRLRLMGKPRPPATPLKRPAPPLWKTKPTDFSAHLDGWRQWAKTTAELRFIKCRAADHGMTYTDLIVGRGTKRIWTIRQKIIWETKQEFPRLSLLRLGRLFCRHHTVIMHSLRKVEAERAAGI